MCEYKSAALITPAWCTSAMTILAYNFQLSNVPAWASENRDSS